VTAPDSGDVLRVDVSDRSIARVHVGGSPAGIAVSAGRVWFTDRDRGEVHRLDPSTLEPVGKTTHLGGRPGWLARAGRYLFVGDALRGLVTRIDVRSGRAAGPPIRVAPPARAGPALPVTAAGDSVWVSSFASTTLTRVSSRSTDAPTAAVARQTATPNVIPLPAGGRVIASIRVPPEGGGFAVGEGAVWAMSNTTSTLMRIDPGRNAVVDRVKVPPGEDVAAGGGAVWLSHPEDDTVSRIDPKTKAVTTIHVRGEPSGVAVSPGAVWIADLDGPYVTRIDPATARIVATIRIGPSDACCAAHMHPSVGTGGIWILLASNSTVVRLDPRTGRAVTTVGLGYSPCGFVAAGARTVWASGGGCADVLARIDPGAKRVTAELTEPHAVGLVVGFGSVWVASTEAGNIDRIDPRTARVVGRLHVGGFPVHLAVGFGSLWVNDDKGRVLRIQPQS
jgi:streptogramin lyase